MSWCDQEFVGRYGRDIEAAIDFLENFGVGLASVVPPTTEFLQIAAGA